MAGEDAYPLASAPSGELCSGAATTAQRITAIVGALFEAGLALDAMRQTIESDYGSGRAGAAGAALETAIRDLRSLAVTLGSGVRPCTVPAGYGEAGGRR